MNGVDIFEQHTWHPLSSWGFSHPFFTLNAHTILYTWAVLAIITIIAFLGRISLRRPHSLGGYLTQTYGKMFIGLIKQSTNECKYRYFAFFTSLFTFILLCNCLVILPLLEEPTKDLNSTIALAFISFFYTQKEALAAHGLIPYLNEFFKTPLQVFGLQRSNAFLGLCEMLIRSILNAIVAIALFPIELLGKCASILSLSFRLFGNIFGGAVISTIWASFRSNSLIFQTIALISGVNLSIVFFFGIFEGILQAFVFSALSLTYLGMAIQEQHD